MGSKQAYRRRIKKRMRSDEYNEKYDNENLFYFSISTEADNSCRRKKQYIYRLQHMCAQNLTASKYWHRHFLV